MTGDELLIHPPCIKGKFPRWGGGGKIIGLLLFWGRILGPATVFLGFSDYFLMSAVEMNIGCKFPNRLEWVLKSVPNRFEETSCARHANICVNAHIPFQKVPKYYEKCLEPVLGEIICID